MSLVKLIGSFIWEWMVGKDVRPGKAFKHHKLRVLGYVLLMLSLLANYQLFNRTRYWYEASDKASKKVVVLKKRIEDLELDNRTMIQYLDKSCHKSRK